MSAKNFFTSRMHEQDPRWGAVDEYAMAALHPSTRPNHGALTKTLEHSRDQGLPDISSPPAYGKFFALQCRMANVKHALEVGTLGGYTSIWIASENPDVHITTLEVSAKHAAVARQNIEAAGLSERVTVIEGPALDALATLKAEVESGQRPKFGFVFIDADKRNNWAYFDLAVQMSLSRGLVFVDNVVRKADIVNEAMLGNENVQGARKVIEEAGKDARVDAVVMQTVNEKSYDGFLMAVVR